MRSADDMAWLCNLVWPEQTGRLANLKRAIAIAQADPPEVVQGDLASDVETAVNDAPDHATLVVFHTAVLAYVTSAARDAFQAAVAATGAVWISNEHPAVLPALTAGLKQAPPQDRFLLAVDGSPVALTGPHGQSFVELRSEQR